MENIGYIYEWENYGDTRLGLKYVREEYDEFIVNHCRLEIIICVI